MCFAMLMGSLAGLFAKNALDAKVSGQVEELTQYCARKNISSTLRRKIVVIMEESYRQEAFSESDMMARLPAAVRHEVETYAYRTLLNRVPLFWEHLDDSADLLEDRKNKAVMTGLTEIMKLFRTLMIQPGETIYKEGEEAFDFYIIIEGEIELSTEPVSHPHLILTSSSSHPHQILSQATRLTHSDGSFFGERELFFSVRHAANSVATFVLIMSGPVVVQLSLTICGVYLLSTACFCSAVPALCCHTPCGTSEVCESKHTECSPLCEQSERAMPLCTSAPRFC